MALTTEEKRQKMIASADRAREKARARALEKLNDPEYRAGQREKQRASLERRQLRQRERQQSPEYRAQQAEKRQRPKAVATSKPPAPRRAKPSRGLKGRAPTADERRIMDLLGKLPCIACLANGVTTEEISLHHIEGRTKPDAHKKQLPLCNHHHQYAAPPEIRAVHPWLVPVHADGNVGGRNAFERLNGTQYELLAEAYKYAGIAPEKH